MAYIKINHEVDPKQKLIDEIGDISGSKILNNQVLVAVYQRPEKTTLGGREWHIANQTLSEDKYQSKVGLIVSYGPTAFQDPEGVWFNGVNIDLHDWVVFPPSSGWNVTVNGVLCRLIDDVRIKIVPPDPDIFY
jgi:hypothetical protein